MRMSSSFSMTGAMISSTYFDADEGPNPFTAFNDMAFEIPLTID